MEITTYQPDPAAHELIELLREQYAGQRNLDYFLKDIERAMGFCVGNDNIRFPQLAGFENRKMRAHGAIIIDRRLPPGEAFFGFLEFPDDASTGTMLWDHLIKTAKNNGIAVLKGPVSGSIWHQYRCVSETDHSPLCKAEPFSQPYYRQFLAAQGPTGEVLYYSAYRRSFEKVLALLDERMRQQPMGPAFSIRETGRATPEELRTIADISRTVFCNSWGYTELTDAEFSALYSSEKLATHPGPLYLLYDREELVGFCGTFWEDEHTLVSKTIALLPRYQGQGLGNALAHRLHTDAAQRGVKKMIYALIREGNAIGHFPKDEAVIFRRYSAFEFSI